MKKVILIIIPIFLASTSYSSKKIAPGKSGIPCIEGMHRIDTSIKRNTIFNPVEIPILYYHNIHERTSKNNPLLTLTQTEFNLQMKSLFDSGYHTISPDQLYLHLIEGITLPNKSVMITFDDAHAEDYFVAQPVMHQYGFKGVFFVNTGYLDKKNYLTTAQVKELSEKGNVIAVHTYNHPDLTTSKNIDWKKQVYFTKIRLEKITGKPVYYFAYPFGNWNYRAIDSLKQYGYRAAFQLSKKQSN
jgi:peptidoglycan/xylan/chitin deacetylase (PgdA/CDA1 family)